jgi:hypothetical protein
MLHRQHFFADETPIQVYRRVATAAGAEVLPMPQGAYYQLIGVVCTEDFMEKNQELKQHFTLQLSPMCQVFRLFRFFSGPGESL